MYFNETQNSNHIYTLHLALVSERNDVHPLPLRLQQLRQTHEMKPNYQSLICHKTCSTNSHHYFSAHSSLWLNKRRHSFIQLQANSICRIRLFYLAINNCKNQLNYHHYHPLKFDPPLLLKLSTSLSNTNRIKLEVAEHITLILFNSSLQ